jgi:hypothetical protein
MKLRKITAVAAVAATLFFTSCKPKDADVQKSLQAKEAAGITVEVKDHVATLSGTVADDAAKAAAAKIATDEKGVESVVNNITVAVPVVVTPTVPASVTTALDATTQQMVKDGLKDIKGVTVEFSADKAVLSGEVSKTDRMKIMQMLASAKVKSDVSKLMDKK